MKVICINDSGWGKGWPVFGETYNVYQTIMDRYKGKPYYYHELIEFGTGITFRVERFALITDIEISETVANVCNLTVTLNS